MSALLLWCAIVLRTQVTTAYVTRNDASIVSSLANGTLSFTSNRRILVEEVDRHGNSIVKELELPDYDEGKEGRDDYSKKVERQNRRQRSDTKRQNVFDCERKRERQQRKCLQRQKRFLKRRYRNWKAVFHRIIRDLDRKIKTIRHVGRRESTTENINSRISSKNVMRNKE